MSEQVSITIITSFASVMINLFTLIGILYMNRNVTKTHNAVNSKMSELLEITAKSARAEGRLER